MGAGAALPKSGQASTTPAQGGKGPGQVQKPGVQPGPVMPPNPYTTTQPNLPPQGGKGGVQQPGQSPYMPTGLPFAQIPPQGGKGPQSPFAMPAQTGPVQPGMGYPQSDLQRALNNAPPSNTPYAGQGSQPMQQPVNPNIPQPIASLGGKGSVPPTLIGPVQQPGQPMPQPAPGNSLMDLVKNAGGQPMPQPYRPAPQPIAQPVQQPRGPADRNIQPGTLRGLGGLAGLRNTG